MVVMIVGLGLAARKILLSTFLRNMGQKMCLQGLRGRPLGRHQCRLEDNIKVDIERVGRGSMDWIVLAQNGDR
jgi:hypothetical protein